MKDVITLEQWERLFLLGKRFKDMKAWKKFSYFNLFAVEIEGIDTAYFTIMGSDENKFGFSMYLGENGLNSIKGIMFGEMSDVNNSLVWMESECISMLLNDREDVSIEQYNVIRELGLKFRGKKNWICFEKKDSGFLADDLKKEDADKLEIYFEKFLDALEYFGKNCDRDFGIEKTEIYLYGCYDGVWSGDFKEVDFSEYVIKKVFFEDEVGIRRIRKKKINNQTWEVDCFLLEGCLDEETNKICVPKCIIIVEQVSKRILRQDVYKYDDSPEEGAKLFLDAVMELGRPNKVIFCDANMEAILEDTCNKCGIKNEIGDVSISKTIEEWMLDYMQNRNLDNIDIWSDDISLEEKEPVLWMKALSQLGIDMEKLKAAAEDMQYDAFQRYFLREIENALENMSEDDYASLSDLQDILSYYWYDEDDDEYDYVRYNLNSAKDKISAINNFFGNGDIAKEQYELYEDNGMWLEINFSNKKWDRMLKNTKKAELLNYAEKMGAFVEKGMNKSMLISVIMDRAVSNKHNLRNALSKDENALMKLLFKKANEKSNEIDIDKFKYTAKDLIALFNLGLIDIGLCGNPYCLVLEVYPLREMADMWKGR